MLSLLYEKFNKPIIFVASTRYEYPFTNNIIKWNWFNEYINTNKNIIPIANNLFDKWYCEQFLNINFQHIPSLCEYTQSKYNFKNDRYILFSKSKNFDIDKLINKSLLGNIHTYSKWGITFEDYMNNLKERKKVLPITKIWTGR